MAQAIVANVTALFSIAPTIPIPARAHARAYIAFCALNSDIRMIPACALDSSSYDYARYRPMKEFTHPQLSPLRMHREANAH